MEMTGEQRIEAPRSRVWAALNDPEILRQCIPGCQSLEMIGDDRMRAVANVKIGPIGAKFAGEVTLSDRDPPNGYRIQGEGQGGAAGSASGGATVRLVEDGGATLLHYEVSAEVGGRLAQLGGPLINATAKQMAAAFFKKFARTMDQAAPPEAAPAEPLAVAPTQDPDRMAPEAPRPLAAPPPAPPVLPRRSGMFWASLLALVAAFGFLLGRGLVLAGPAFWNGLMIGTFAVIVAVAAFELGARAGSPRS